ncbi:MAG TPA: hypothetical protein VIK35_00065 [Verrucomicrobiae bacterium]
MKEPNSDKALTGEANPMPPPVIEAGDTGAEPLKEEPQPTQPTSIPTAHRWRRFWGYFAKVVATLFGVGSTILFLLALWDSYRPKITITPGVALNAKSPFGTLFIIQNQGSLPISHITYRTRLTSIPIPGTTNQLSTSEQNASVVPQMKSLESYAFSIRYIQVQFPNPTNTPSTNKDMAVNTVQCIGFTLSFDVSYNPKFFGKRTDTLFFYGVQDMDGNWQWFPTGHQSIFAQTIDTNLIQSLPSPLPAAIPTNGGFQVHTNQTKPT